MRFFRSKKLTKPSHYTQILTLPKNFNFLFRTTSKRKTQKIQQLIATKEDGQWFLYRHQSRKWNKNH